jgi:hypothetical protein
MQKKMMFHWSPLSLPEDGASRSFQQAPTSFWLQILQAAKSIIIIIIIIIVVIIIIIVTTI